MQNRSPLRSLAILKSNNMKISDRLIKKSHMRLFEGPEDRWIHYWRFHWRKSYFEVWATLFRYNRSHLSLVIAATSNCNFRCVYCYEGSVLRASTMSEAIQETIVKFVESEAPHLETFTVTWYGGKPLLALDIIENLSIKFVDICKKECHCLRCNNCNKRLFAKLHGNWKTEHPSCKPI